MAGGAWQRRYRNPQASRRFVALSSEKLDAFMNADLSELDLLVIQIDGTACQHRPSCCSPPSASTPSMATSIRSLSSRVRRRNTATVQALLDNLVERGLDPGRRTALHRRWREGALEGDPGQPSARRLRSSAARSTRHAISWIAWPKELHATTRRVLRQAWELDDADKAEKNLIRKPRTTARPGQTGSGCQHPRGA